MIDRDYAQFSRYTRGISEPRGPILLSGTQALVRMLLAQAQADRRAGRDTAGFVSGYRGSPLGSVDLEMWRAAKLLDAANVRFHPAVNEELAATAVLGSQKVETDPTRARDGVFAMWYGKGPGVDRSGDALRHGNAYGASPTGGVLVVAGDDHGCASSSMSHQSDLALIAWGLPVVHPASIADYVEFGLWGWALSRFCGLWVGFKAVTETVETVRTLDDDAGRAWSDALVLPPVDAGPDGLHWRWPDLPGPQIERRLEYKARAAAAFAAANPLERLAAPCASPKCLIAAVGKAYLDVLEALRIGGLTPDALARAGVALMKVGLVSPLSPALAALAARVDEVFVVEEKAAVVEPLLKAHLYGAAHARPRIVGKHDEAGRPLLPSATELRPSRLAAALASRLGRYGLALREPDHARSPSVPPLALPKRKPFFCAGCPHNASTRVPDGSRAQLGIGCHALAAQMPERNTSGSVQMGGEGVDWIGQSPFVREPHIFQNLGDGTLFHSGHLAVRQAVAAGVNVTYKILYNDAVAMTGGQPIDGRLTVAQITRLMQAEGVRRIVVVTPEPAAYRTDGFADGVGVEPRERLDAVQRELRDARGVSVLIYDQVCATEERRRRKKAGAAAAARARPKVFINESVCEGCGDCQRQSNCLAVVPVDTEFGRKRQIDQQACNSDLSCLAGFCPSFVTIDGASGAPSRDRARADAALARVAQLPLPETALGDAPYELAICGIGGTGVVTVAGVVALAAHLEGNVASTLNFSGFAQKGGAVLSHLRIARPSAALHQARIDTGRADAMIAADLVVASAGEALEMIRPGHTRIVANLHEAQTGAMLRDPDASVDVDAIDALLRACAGASRVASVDAHARVQAIGGALYGNMFLLGYAWQLGLVPVSLGALERAIDMLGADAPSNRRAFSYGRLEAAGGAHGAEGDGGEDGARGRQASPSVDDRVESRAAYLAAYQDARYASRYRARVDAARAAGERIGDARLADAVAVNLFRLMACKDEYEVARLHTEPAFLDRIAAEFGPGARVSFHLRAPLAGWLSRERGAQRAIRVGAGMLPALRMLAWLRRLRGTPFDVFGYLPHRRAERRLIAEYDALLDEVLPSVTAATADIALMLLDLPQTIRGYGEIKRRSIAEAALKRREWLARYRGARTGRAKFVPIVFERGQRESA
ncbi:indolepyruvate ferredoxin oxidoreductase family protein [Burkholderia thailandensis]|uniref:Pyruvate ferredoxin/flavodoxin oxidoreductase family protein n=1 Tax=Burkholderia thailandensis (strain ATCC 700388 / DSM 13276 / CCUG 48851 / CIP 106301 / E264) TaxID=271848 RepID=Q2T4P2_BURTA|nr:indolepyruvate ferredoxin oxidoreductase family protein [Burkholderia thailandensis]ABC36202.1 pyruvate ferredoxin/flavodoxin oxidoreductase family protein [Burkholderia thailandensis E264]AHI77136.1 pyruvate ferredoxin/flavodoxin oxidoreductase family protein [Burkholderia thailandensis 2002721723]AIP28273.1 pyruvate ferredoxin/flavodoxin oxidoreductase family protein [Burkholderia thailandensis E264]AIS97767.1 pyruvate ferredoxin/flavodoxin oxidoreductase family protein [Burkholderia thail